MHNRGVAATLLFAGILALVATTHAQTYPAKPIRIVTVAPGGTPGPLARLISQGITGALGQPLVVDNRVGFVGIEIVSKAPPDGLHAGGKRAEPLDSAVPSTQSALRSDQRLRAGLARHARAQRARRASVGSCEDRRRSHRARTGEAGRV